LPERKTVEGSINDFSGHPQKGGDLEHQQQVRAELSQVFDRIIKELQEGRR
jgi:hypothetical protein